MLSRPFLLHSRNVRPVTPSGRTVADILPVLLEHVSTPSKSFSEVNLSTWKVFVIIAIFMRVFSHFAKDLSIFTQSMGLGALDGVQDLKASPDWWAGIIKVLSRFSKSHCYLVLDNLLLFVLICGCQEKTLISTVYTKWWNLMLYGYNVLRNMLLLGCKTSWFWD